MTDEIDVYRLKELAIALGKNAKISKKRKNGKERVLLLSFRSSEYNPVNNVVQRWELWRWMLNFAWSENHAKAIRAIRNEDYISFVLSAIDLSEEKNKVIIHGFDYNVIN